MKWIIIGITAVLLFIFLAWLDFWSGQKSHHKKPQVFNFDEVPASLDFIDNGIRLFDSMFQELNHAKSSIYMMFFTITKDPISQELLSILKSKAQQGVKVYLLLDRFGSFKFSKKDIQELQNSGVNFAYSQSPSFPFLFYKIQRRNHRKITVIDGEIGYTGGYNVGKEYIGKDPKFGNWRDYHLRVKGRMVSQLSDVFIADWKLTTGKELSHTKIAPKEQPNQMLTKVFPTDGVHLEDTWIQLFDNAQEEILIGTPYFIPSSRLLNSLFQAAARGVKVSVIVPIKKDHPLVKETTLYFSKKAVPKGIKVHQFKEGFYHSKVIIIDQKICDVGTANMDYRSLRLNKEVNVFFKDPVFIQNVRSIYFSDLERSIPLTKERLKEIPIGTRIVGQIGYLVRGLL
ncbi:cardiolipin synthase [Bacillaceae bacterium S4-13-56]